jgi:hypothetical protein
MLPTFNGVWSERLQSLDYWLCSRSTIRLRFARWHPDNGDQGGLNGRRRIAWLPVEQDGRSCPTSVIA